MKMLDYIRNQPEILKKIICSRRQYLKAVTEKTDRNPYDRIILVGSGSSYNSCMIAKPLMEKLYGREVTVLLPTSDAAFLSLKDEKKLILAVSQEGTSSNTYAFIQKAKKSVPEATTFAVTAVTGSKLTEVCESTIVIGCGNETVGPKTVGVTSTVLTLWLVALELKRMEGRISDEKCEDIITGIMEELGWMPENILTVEQWTNSNKEFWSNACSLAFLGKNQYLGIVSESALKIDETLFIPSSAYDFEEFLHGPFCLFEKQGVRCVILCSPEDDIDRIRRLKTFGEGKNISCIMAGAGRDNGDELEIKLKIKNSDYAVFSLLLPAQIAAAIVSEYMGQPVEGHDFISFSSMMKSKL
ncbi:MAG: SIS domain-containing protein [Eubacteriales bacterium]|nr:SIS domain-containing protein [Eubacteriales bacterium]